MAVRHHVLLAAVFATATMTTGARADDVAGKGVDVTPPSFVPTLQISGNADKSVSLKVAGDLRFYRSGRQEAWSIAPTLSATAPGDNSTLLTVGGEPAPSSTQKPPITAWSLGIMLGYSWLPEPREISVHSNLALQERTARVMAVHQCRIELSSKSTDGKTWLDLCTQGGSAVVPGLSDPQDKAYCDALGSHLPAIAASQLCSSGKKSYDDMIGPVEAEATTIRRVSYQFPVDDVSVWLGAGQSLFTYLQSSSGDASQGTAVYSSQSESHPNLGIAARFVYVQPGTSVVGLTFDAQAAAQSAFQGSRTTATSCALQGTMSGTSNTVSVCSTEALNPPSFAPTAMLGAFVGVVDKDHALWRVDAGPSFTSNPNAGTWTLSGSIPLYVNVVALVGGLGTSGAADSSGGSKGGGDYSGIVRLAPTIQYATLAKGGNDTQFLITIAFLAQRTLFQRADALVK
jgi:hypothetical protein